MSQKRVGCVKRGSGDNLRFNVCHFVENKASKERKRKKQ